MESAILRIISATLIAGLTVMSVLIAETAGTPGVAAHPCPPAGDHDDFHGTGCGLPAHDEIHHDDIPVNAGWDEELVFKAFLPDVSVGTKYLQMGDEIAIPLTGFDLSKFDGGNSRTLGLITISDSVDPFIGGDPGNPGTLANPRRARVEEHNNTVVLELPDLEGHNHGAEEYLEITFGKGTGILTPEIPNGFDNDAEGYLVKLTFRDESAGIGTGETFEAQDENYVVVRNPVSSTVPGDAVRIELPTSAQGVIRENDEITVDFEGPSPDSSFTVPGSITASDVTIRPVSGASFSPSGVLVQGRKVILTVPSDKVPAASIQGQYEIIFSQSAGIMNPLSAGNRVITVSSTAHGDEIDFITAVIKRTTTVTPVEGARGSEFVLQGKGYAKGTVTVFDGDDDVMGPGEILTSMNTVSGAFNVTLTARGDFGDPEYKVRTLDSNGTLHEVIFSVVSSISLQPVEVGPGSLLTITIEDWDEPDQGPDPGVAAVTVAGHLAYISRVVELDDCLEFTGMRTPDASGRVTLDVLLPAEVPPGDQTVSVFGPSQIDLPERPSATPKKACGPDDSRSGRNPVPEDEAALKPGPEAIASETVKVLGRILRVVPDTAARGQRVSITGTGFFRGEGERSVRSVTIGARRVDEDPSRARISANGDVAFDVTVPHNIPGGTNEVRVEGSEGSVAHATLTIPEATVAVEPPAGGRGSEMQVTGSGFVAHGLVSIYYGNPGTTPQDGELLGITIADAQGGFSKTLSVPLWANIGEQYRVTARSGDPDGDTRAANGASTPHTLPAGTLVVEQETACPGDSLTVRGENLPPFSRVGPFHFGQIEVIPRPYPFTDETGAFEAAITVPHLELGHHTLSAAAAGSLLADVIEVVGPPLSGPPERVFKELIRAGALSRVWRFDNSTQSWSFFDPDPDFSAFNDLAEVASGDILWMNLHEPLGFQGDSLRAGWNQVQLK